MSSHMRTSEKVKVMDDFSQVMVNSGHVIEVVQRALMNGIKGHLRKVERCFRDGKEFYRCAASRAQPGKARNKLKNEIGLKPVTVMKLKRRGDQKAIKKYPPHPHAPKRGGPGTIISTKTEMRC